ncbi:MAG: hypothetical protein AB7H71_18635 [Alphaproteobacteria bacterium]
MTETIVLGGLQLEVRPLKLGQLRHVLDALENMAGQSGGALIETAVRVVAAGLAPTHPELTVEKVLDLEAGIEELNEAVAAVLRTAGLRLPRTALEPQSMGEASPVASPAANPPAAPASSSPRFTAPSPPAAAIPIR